MKKSLVALAIAGLVAASSAATAATVYDKDGTSLAVYGRVQSVFYSDKTGVADIDPTDQGGDATIKSSARFGLDVRSQLNSQAAAFAKAEWEASNGDNKGDGDDGFMARYLWVGLDFGQFGSVKVGKFEEAIKYAIGQSDIFDDWGCLGLAGNDDRREGMIMYEWSGNGIDLKASFGLAKSASQVDGAYFNKSRESLAVERSYSIAVGYTSPKIVFGPIAVRAGYAGGTFGDKAKGNDYGFYKTPGDNSSWVNEGVYDSYSQYAIGVSWGDLAAGPYVGAVYQQRSFDIKEGAGITWSNDYDVTGYEIVAGYAFANGVSVRTGYLTQKVKFDDGGADDVKAGAIPVYINYQLNPQFNIWGEASFSAGTDDDKNGGKNFVETVRGYAGQADENVFSAGLRYVF